MILLLQFSKKKLSIWKNSNSIKKNVYFVLSKSMCFKKILIDIIRKSGKNRETCVF